jgi:hypothetical protein
MHRCAPHPQSRFRYGRLKHWKRQGSASDLDYRTPKKGNGNPIKLPVLDLHNPLYGERLLQMRDFGILSEVVVQSSMVNTSNRPGGGGIADLFGFFLPRITVPRM